jgi:hypothetical protein
MTASLTVTESTTFTLSHARHIVAKIATDLKRMQRFYGLPSDTDIESYQSEAIEMFKAGYLDTVSYGFRRNGILIEPTLVYRAKDLLGTSSIDEAPGRIPPNANIDGATFYSYVRYAAKWFALTDQQRETFESSLTIVRGSAPEPSFNGYLETDKTYSAGGRAVTRQSLRGYA